jgi:hypothetical protein
MKKRSNRAHIRLGADARDTGPGLRGFLPQFFDFPVSD